MLIPLLKIEHALEKLLGLKRNSILLEEVVEIGNLPFINFNIENRAISLILAGLREELKSLVRVLEEAPQDVSDRHEHILSYSCIDRILDLIDLTDLLR